MGCFILIHISKKHIREISFAGSITTSDPHNTTLGAEINLGKLRDMYTQEKNETVNLIIIIGGSILHWVYCVTL